MILTGAAFEVKERWFKQAGGPLLRATNMMISDSFPLEEIEPHSKKFNAEKAAEFEKCKKRAQNFLYEQRNLVNDKWLTRYEISRKRPNQVLSEADAEATEEMIHLLIDGALDRLFENLVNYAPLYVDPKYVDPLRESLTKVYAAEADRLRSYLQNFVARYVEGVRPLAQELE